MTRERYPGGGGRARGAPAELARPDAIALIVGIVVGAHLPAPSLVAATPSGEAAVLLLWSLGGWSPHRGHVLRGAGQHLAPRRRGLPPLRRALGESLAFLFAWARLTVIPTGSIALLGFIFGDYASQLLPLGRHSSASYAALSVVVLTGLNVAGIHLGKWTQNLLIGGGGAEGLVIVAGLFFSPRCCLSADGVCSATSRRLGPGDGVRAADVRRVERGGLHLQRAARGTPRHRDALLWSMVVVTGLYLLANMAYLNGLGLAGMGRSEAVAAELMLRVAGPCAQLISLVICAAVLTLSNATILMGSRTYYALGRTSRCSPCWGGGARGRARR